MPELLLPIIMLIVGFAFLIKGGDWFVDGASGIARRFHLPEILIGATVVSIGTTLPEVMVSAGAALQGSGSIAYGNAIGSIICNTSLIAAITIAIKPSLAPRKSLVIPVAFFFGSALTNFGIEPFLESFLQLTPPPLSRVSDMGEIDTFDPNFSAFVFKIQANMNKAHRDRLAFMRICSGKFQRDTEYFHVQGNKKMRLSQPQQLMAAEREIVDEAYAGDVIGVFDPGIFSIGDTITVTGKKFRYSGIPTFAPEHFCRVSAKDSMKRKQFVKGTEQIAQEGAIQIFKVPNSGMEEVIVGVVGTLQFDVFQYRLFDLLIHGPHPPFHPVPPASAWPFPCPEQWRRWPSHDRPRRIGLRPD